MYRYFSSGIFHNHEKICKIFLFADKGAVSGEKAMVGIDKEGAPGVCKLPKSAFFRQLRSKAPGL